jgi:hypothetical protein
LSWARYQLMVGRDSTPTKRAEKNFWRVHFT